MERNVVVALYADQNGSWDARNDRNEIVAVGSKNDPMPQKGSTVPLPDYLKA